MNHSDKAASRRWVYGLGLLILLVDGFDMMGIGFVAPVLARDLPAAREHLTAIVTTGLLGWMLGGLLGGLPADRWGRRPVMLCGLLLTGAGSLLAAASATWLQLLVARLCVGIGFGFVSMNAPALAAEHSPSQRRSTVVMLLTTGNGAGAALAGFVASWLLAGHGSWRMLFLGGGGFTLLLLPLAAWRLVESPELKHLRPQPGAAASAAFRPGWNASWALLRQQRMLAFLASSLLVYVMCQTSLQMIGNWMTVLLVQCGYTPALAARTAAMVHSGGVVAGLSLGFLLDRFSTQRVLSWIFVPAWLSLALLGLMFQIPWMAGALCWIAGFGVIGGMQGVLCWGVRVYPAPVRAMSIGLTQAAGRLGAVAGPVLGGVLLGGTRDPATVSVLLSLPALIMILALGLAGRAAGRVVAEPALQVADPAAA